MGLVVLCWILIRYILQETSKALTASSKIKSHTDLNRIKETRGNITAKGGYLLVNERNIDEHTFTHHS